MKGVTEILPFSEIAERLEIWNWFHLITRVSSSEEYQIADEFTVNGKNMYFFLGDSSSITSFH